MASRYPQPVFLDTTVLSNFSSTDDVTILTAILESPVVVPAVREELERGLEAGHDFLDTAVDTLDDGLNVHPAPSDGNFRDVRERLDPGEAESLLAAIEHAGTLATDDLAARRTADQRGIQVTGSIGLLVLGVERGKIDRTTADGRLDTWRELRGYYAPVDTVSEILDDA